MLRFGKGELGCIIMAKGTTRGKGGRSASRSTARQLYSERLKAIKPLVSIALRKAGKETRSDQRKVLRYYKYLIGDGKQPGVSLGVKAKVTSRSKKKLAELQKAIGQGQLPGIRYAFVPSVIEAKTKKVAAVKIKQTGKLPIVKIGDVCTVTLPFDVENFIDDREIMEGAIEEMMVTLEEYAKGAEVVRFRIATGEHGQTRMYASLQNYEVVDEVLRIMNRYTESKRPGHDWGNWLYGLSIEFANNQRDMYARTQAFSRRREGMREIRKLRTDYGGILEVVSGQNVSYAEQIARDFAGRTDDPDTMGLLKSMTKRKLLKRTGDQFQLSQEGRRYLKAFTDAQQKIGRL